jgi:helicase
VLAPHPSAGDRPGRKNPGVMASQRKPRFQGIFMGIDRYGSPDIHELRYAEQDATALHALFADNLGDGGELLVGSTVSRSEIERRFKQLAEVNPDDVVVVSFSGHGSETHELVTYDADLRDQAGSCIPLDLLTRWFRAIPARRVVCILDCCFSGAMGAKVLQVESKPRALRSEDSLLDQLAGDGRLILTASTADQPAYENPRLGHGLLTHYLLQALQGAEEVRSVGKVAVYRILEYVTKRVIDAAGALYRADQRPTLRGTLDGELTWPVFTAGKNYAKAFPDRGRSPVTEELTSLAKHGFPDEIIDAWVTEIDTLNQLQLDAINDYALLDGEHLVVSAPTSSGKTMIGELAALNGILQRRRALFLLPMKALVNDKYQEFLRKYAALGVRTIRATGDFNDDVGALIRGQYDICLMTYEKCAALALGAPHILDAVGTIVIDEVQMIVDPSRGANLEFLLTLLRVRRQRGSEPQTIALSAVIGDTNGLERWFDARLLRREQRPVPLDEGVLRQDGSVRYIATDEDGGEQIEPFIHPIWGRGSSQDWIIPLVKKLVDDGEQVIVFREQKGQTVGCATYLARELGLPPAQDTIDALPTGDPSVSSGDLRRTLAGGVAFHNADLDRDERLAIEEHFRSSDHPLQVIVATTTLAMGVNTPASTVVIAGLRHPLDQPYTVAEYKNMVGRAGRLGFTERGRSLIIAPDFRQEHEAWQDYVTARPEDLHSRFLDADPRALVLRVLTTSGQVTGGPKMTAADLVAFLEGSFGAFQQRQRSGGWRWSEQTLAGHVAELERHGLIVTDAEQRYELTPLGRLAGESGIAVGSILRIVDVVRRLSPQALDDNTLVALTQLTEELDDVYFPLNKKSKRKEPAAWFGALQQHRVSHAVIEALRYNAELAHQPTLRAKKAAGCYLWMDGRAREEIERILMQFDRNQAAAGPLSSIVNRMLDILPTVIRVAEVLHDADLSERESQLMLRLQIGLPVAMVPIATAMGTELSRAQYLALHAAGLTTAKRLKDADPERLLSILGRDEDLRQQVLEAVRQTMGLERAA